MRTLAARHLLADIGEAQATFLFVLLAFAGDDLRIDNYQLVFGILPMLRSITVSRLDTPT